MVIGFSSDSPNPCHSIFLDERGHPPKHKMHEVIQTKPDWQPFQPTLTFTLSNTNTLVVAALSLHKNNRIFATEFAKSVTKDPGYHHPYVVLLVICQADLANIPISSFLGQFPGTSCWKASIALPSHWKFKNFPKL